MNVKQLRMARRLTQRTLAYRAKLSQAFIAQLETGAESNPTLITLRRLAKALNVTVGELVDKPD